MAITVVCAALTWYDAATGTYQRCGETWDVPDDQAGRTSPCPVCGTPAPVPRPVPNLAEIARRRDEDPDVLPFPPDDEPTPTRPGPAAPSRPASSRPALSADPAPDHPASARTASPSTARPGPAATPASGPAGRPGDVARPSGPTREAPSSRPASPRPASPSDDAARPIASPRGGASPLAAIPVAPAAPRPPAAVPPTSTPAAPGPAPPGGLDDFYGVSDDPQSDFALAPATDRPPLDDPLFADLPPLPAAGPGPGGVLPTSPAGRSLATAEQTLVQAGGPPTVRRCPKCGAPVHELLCLSCGYHQGLKRQVSDFTPQDAETRGFMRTMEAHVQGLPPRAALAWAVGMTVLLAIMLAYLLWMATIYSYLLTLPALAAAMFALWVSGLRRADGSKVFDAWTATLLVQRALGWRSGTKGQAVVAVARRGRDFTDADLDDLEQWYDVEALDLQGTAVTDRGLASLVAMPRLTYLVVRDTPVTERAVLGFQKRRPKVWVWR